MVWFVESSPVCSPSVPVLVDNDDFGKVPWSFKPFPRIVMPYSDHVQPAQVMLRVETKGVDVAIVEVLQVETGGRLNKKDRLTGYGDSHVKDKTSYRPSYL